MQTSFKIQQHLLFKKTIRARFNSTLIFLWKTRGIERLLY